MSLTKKVIIEQLLNHFEILKVNDKFSEFLDFLQSKNISLEVRLETFYQILDSDQFSEDSDSLFYIYNKSIYLDKGSLKNDFQKSNVELNSKEKADILYEAHRKLYFLYSFGTFNKLKNFLQDTNDCLEIDWATDYSLSESEINKMVGKGPFGQWENILYTNLTFFSAEHLLFLIFGNRYYNNIKEENERFTEQYFISCVRSSTDLINLKEIECYQKFSPKTQKFINAGNMFLDNYFKSNVKKMLDLSPLLLDFTKALECEVKDFYDSYYSYIIPQAELISSNRELLKNSKFSRGRTDYLILLSKNILTFKRNYQPSCIKPLAYFLYFFGLGEELSRLFEFEGFFSLSQREKVFKDISVIDRLFSSMEKRNEFIHSKMIESRNEFLMLYSDIVLTFQLIGSLK